MSQSNLPDLKAEQSKTMIAPLQGTREQAQALSPDEKIATLEAELAQYRAQRQEGATSKSKEEKTKAVFHVLEHVVRYYNTGETYFSRALTLLGLGGIVASGIFGASQVPALRSQFSETANAWRSASSAPMNADNGKSLVSQESAVALSGLSTAIQRVSHPLKPVAPQATSPRSLIESTPTAPPLPAPEPAIPEYSFDHDVDDEEYDEGDD
jgi:hypothetical protein